MERIIICDLDGTLCNCDHRIKYAHKQDWEKFNALCTEDTVNEAIANIIRSLRSDKVKIYLVSGRDDRFEKQTKDWLFLNDIPYDELFMRKNKDYRSDTVIKEDILDDDILPSDIWFVLDDRKSVVDMWRRNGLRCLQVQEGDF